MNQRTSTTLPRRSSTWSGDELNQVVVSHAGAGLPTALDTSVLSASGPIASAGCVAAEIVATGLGSSSGAAAGSSAALWPQPSSVTAVKSCISLVGTSAA